MLRLGKTSPVASWVRALARDIYDPAAGVGVVGMCLTGGLALTSVIEPAVHAAVSAHPGLPSVIPWSRQGFKSPHLHPTLMTSRNGGQSAEPIAGGRYMPNPYRPTHAQLR